MRCRDSTQAHARRVNNESRRQISGAGDRCFTNSDRSLRIALLLYRGAAAAANRAGNACTKHEVVVGCVDNRVDVLLDQVAADDHDSPRRHSSTSATRSANATGVAFAIPFTPIDPIVMNAQATPHTIASCKPLGSPPVLNHRASIPPASASPPPLASTTARSAIPTPPPTPHSLQST